MTIGIEEGGGGTIGLVAYVATTLGMVGSGEGIGPRDLNSCRLLLWTGPEMNGGHCIVKYIFWKAKDLYNSLSYIVMQYMILYKNMKHKKLSHLFYTQADMIQQGDLLYTCSYDYILFAESKYYFIIITLSYIIEYTENPEFLLVYYFTSPVIF